MLRTMDRPTKATLRRCLTATLSTCCTRCTCEAKQATMMRCLVLAKISSSTGAMSRSEVTTPGTSALVESDISRSTPSVPSRAKPGQVGEPAVQRQLVHLEVAGVQHHAGRGADGHGERVGNRVVDREELAVERAERAVAALHHLDGDRIEAVLGQLALHQGQGQPRAGQRDVRTLPEQVRDRADVVLVGVREDDRLHLGRAAPPGSRSPAGSGPRRADRGRGTAPRSPR